MQVTLKKAAELSRAALAASKVIKPKRTVAISLFTTAPVATSIENARVAFNDSLARSIALVNAAYEIRNLLAVANSGNVNALLTKVAAIDETIDRINAAVGTEVEDEYDSATESDDIAAVENRVILARDEIANPEHRRYGMSRDTIKASVLDANMKQSLLDEIAKLKRLRANRKDELTAINFINKVTLPEAVIIALRAENLID